MEELSSKVVMVRFDSSILIQQEVDRHTPITTKAYETIKYIYKAGAKIILTSSWNLKHCCKALSVEDVAGASLIDSFHYLVSILLSVVFVNLKDRIIHELSSFVLVFRISVISSSTKSGSC